MLESIRNGIRFFLMCLGISSPNKKPAPPPQVPKK